MTTYEDGTRQINPEYLARLCELYTRKTIMAEIDAESMSPEQLNIYRADLFAINTQLTTLEASIRTWEGVTDNETIDMQTGFVTTAAVA